MNVRRMVMVMLVLGFMVQGASAESWVVSSYISGGYYNGSGNDVQLDTFTIPGTFYNTPGYVHITGRVNCVSGCYYDGGSVLAEVSTKGWLTNANVSVSESLYLRTAPSSGSISYSAPIIFNKLGAQTVLNTQVHWGATAGRHVEMLAVSSVVVLTTESPQTAAGSSCTGTGAFDIYTNGSYTYTDSDDGNYSFTIFDGIEYQIYFAETAVWHNFTASGSDETWNPCPAEYSVSGRVIGPDGEGTNNLQMFLLNYDVVGPYTTQDETYTDSKGNYSFPYAPNGVYIIQGQGNCFNGLYGWSCAKYIINPQISKTNGSALSVPSFTYPLQTMVRFNVLNPNGTAISSAILDIKDVESGSGSWGSTSDDGWTWYNLLYPSSIYVDYHGGDGAYGPGGSETLYSWEVLGDAQPSTQSFTLTLPLDYANNTTIPPVVDPVNETEYPDITTMDTDTMFLVTVRDSVSSAPLKDVTVTATAINTSCIGQFKRFTNVSGQTSFPRNYTIGRYRVSAAITCYYPQTKNRTASATFDMVYSCGPLPGTDENGTGNWNENASNWSYNGTLNTENDMKAKVSSLVYLALSILGFVMLATYFIKK